MDRFKTKNKKKIKKYFVLSIQFFLKKRTNNKNSFLLLFFKMTELLIDAYIAKQQEDYKDLVAELASGRAMRNYRQRVMAVTDIGLFGRGLYKGFDVPLLDCLEQHVQRWTATAKQMQDITFTSLAEFSQRGFGMGEIVITMTFLKAMLFVEKMDESLYEQAKENKPKNYNNSWNELVDMLQEQCDTVHLVECPEMANVYKCTIQAILNCIEKKPDAFESNIQILEHLQLNIREFDTLDTTNFCFGGVSPLKIKAKPNALKCFRNFEGCVFTDNRSLLLCAQLTLRVCHILRVRPSSRFVSTIEKTELFADIRLHSIDDCFSKNPLLDLFFDHHSLMNKEAVALKCIVSFQEMKPETVYLEPVVAFFLFGESQAELFDAALFKFYSGKRTKDIFKPFVGEKKENVIVYKGVEYNKKVMSAYIHV